eukprot:3799384-Amphidinium_carterae.1
MHGMKCKKLMHITGRHMMFKDAMQRMQALNLTRHAHGDRPYTRHETMRKHGQNWHSLSADAQQRYNAMALAYRHDQECDINEAISELGARLDMEQMRLTEVQNRRTQSMQTSSCTLSDTDFNALTVLHNTTNVSASDYSKHFASRTKCPEPCSESQLQNYIFASDLDTDVSADHTASYTMLAENRLHMQGSVIGIRTDGDSMDFYLFLFALLKPVQCFFMPLEEIGADESAAHTLDELQRVARTDFTNTWVYDDECSTTEDIFAGVTVEDIVFYPSCLFKSPGCVVSFHELSPWAPLHDMWNEEKRARLESLRARTKDTPGMPSKPETEEHRWYAAYVASQKRHQKKQSTPQPAQQQDDTVEDPDLEPHALHTSSPNETVDDVFRELEALRQDMPNSSITPQTDFRVCLMGGSWQMRRTGRETYGCRVDMKAGTDIKAFALVGFKKALRP